jgi:hypothetical protein
LFVRAQTSIAAEPTLTPLLLAAWSSNATVSLVAEGMVDVLQALLDLSPQACTSVQVNMLPTLVTILRQDQANVAVTGTVRSALELLQHVLLKAEKHKRKLAEQAAAAAGNASAVAIPELLHPLLFSDLLPLSLTLLLHTDDHGLIEVGTPVLAAYLRADAARVSAASVPVVMPGAPQGSQPTPASGLQLLCVIVNQLLNPALEDQLANNVGTLVVQLVFSCGAQLGEANLKELIKAGQSSLSSASVHTPVAFSFLLCGLFC